MSKVNYKVPRRETVKKGGPARGTHNDRPREGGSAGQQRPVLRYQSL